MQKVVSGVWPHAWQKNDLMAQILHLDLGWSSSSTIFSKPS